MHRSAIEHMRRETAKLIRRDLNFTVLDFGSQTVSGHSMTHREMFEGCRYIGVDIEPGLNVNIVMKQPYRIPLPSKYADLIVSGQVFEHIPFPWISILELDRVLKPGGYLVISAPSRGHRHSLIDCWRYYPDAFRALAAFAGLKLIKATTDFPPRRNDGGRHDFSAIKDSEYWGDTIAVMRRPIKRPLRRRIFMLVMRPLLRLWGNRSNLGSSHPQASTSTPR